MINFTFRDFDRKNYGIGSILHIGEKKYKVLEIEGEYTHCEVVKM